MKTFSSSAAQGEIYIRRIGDVPASINLPDGFSPMPQKNGKFVIGESETHHDHCVLAERVSVGVMDRPPAGMRILRMIVENPTALIHERGNDTHDPIMFEPGEYEVRIQREFDPYAELARQVAD